MTSKAINTTETANHFDRWQTIAVAIFMALVALGLYFVLAEAT